MQSDFAVIEKFLHRIGERTRHSLAAIHSIKPGLQGSTYEAKQLPYMLKYIENQQKAGYGIYYSLNEGVHVTKQRGFNGKLLANEIIRVHMLGFDIDYITGNEAQRIGYEQRAISLLMSQMIPPSVIVSTGGGIQVLFIFHTALPVALSNAKVPTPQEAIDDVVAIGFRDDVAQLYSDIVAALAGALSPMLADNLIKIDKLSNIDRVFRLPGTVNFPTPVKIEKGATVRLARIVYDEGQYTDFWTLRESIPKVTKTVERKEKTDFVERPNATWTHYKKALFLCEYVRDHKLVDDNQNYTHDLMFPLFGMINKNEITAAQGRELWLIATSTGRETAYGNYERKWDTRKIANYTNRDLGSLIFYCRSHDCLLPWSIKDEEKKIDMEAREITAESMRHPVLASEEDFF